MADKMTPETAAYRLFDMGYDCAQTVLAHFADDLDLEEETALMSFWVKVCTAKVMPFASIPVLY